MSDKEVVSYFMQHKGSPVCGRFHNTQLNRDLEIISPEVLLMNISAWKKYLAILFICFSGMLTGCKQGAAENKSITAAGTSIDFTYSNFNLIKDKVDSDSVYTAKEENQCNTAFVEMPPETLGYAGIDYQLPKADYQFPFEIGLLEKIFGPPKK